jgi:tetratricopeptide (TPR) repeat protein
MSDTRSGSKTEEFNITEKLNELIRKNRKALVFGFAGIAVILAGFVITLTVREKLRERAYTRVDEFDNRYEALKYRPEDEPGDEYSFSGEMNVLMADLDTFVRKNSGYAAARAYSLMAVIQEDQKNWAEAEQAWSAAAKAAAKTYLAPVSLYNAAVAAEEQGKLDSAIDLYTQASDYGASFPAAARAQFSVGRLYESRNNKQAAIDAYRDLLGKWPNDPLWGNLAQSRIIVLSE